MKNRIKRLIASKFKKFLVFTLFVLTACNRDNIPLLYEQPNTEPIGTALVITGAGGRISQELALIERLYEKGELDDLGFISGTSAGSIMAMNLNRILDPNYPFDWDDLKNILFSIRQEDLFANPRNDLPVDIRGAWNLFDKLVTETLNIKSISKDLIYPTSFTSVKLSDRSIARVTNVKGIHSITDSPVEGLMSSFAVPIVFPSIRIEGVDYVDGGLVDNVPISPVFEYQLLRNRPFKKIIIISYQRRNNSVLKWDVELPLLFLRGKRLSFVEEAFRASGFSSNSSRNDMLIQRLKFIRDNYPEFASRVEVYTPKIRPAPYFPLFQFDGKFGETEYNMVRNWALKNDPVPINKFLENYN